MTNTEMYLKNAATALDQQAYSPKERAFIRQLLTYDKKQLRNLTSHQYDWLRKLSAQVEDEKGDEEKAAMGDHRGHGGIRIGAGRHSAEELGIEKRVQVPLSILPSVINSFKKKHGRGWSRRVEELIKADLDHQA